MQAYHEIFVGSDQPKSLNAAIAWSKWEARTSKLIQNKGLKVN